MDLASRLNAEATRAGLLLQDYTTNVSRMQSYLTDIAKCEAQLAFDGIGNPQLRDIIVNAQQQVSNLRVQANSEMSGVKPIVLELDDFVNAFGSGIRYSSGQPVSVDDIKKLLIYSLGVVPDDFLPVNKAIADASKLVLNDESGQQHRDAAHVRSKLIEAERYVHRADAARYNLMMTLEERSRTNPNLYALPEGMREKTASQKLGKLGMGPIFHEGRNYYVPGSINILLWNNQRVDILSPLATAIVELYSQFLDFGQISKLIGEECRISSFIAANRQKIASIEINRHIKFNAAQFAGYYKPVIMNSAVGNVIKAFSEKYLAEQYAAPPK